MSLYRDALRPSEMEEIHARQRSELGNPGISRDCPSARFDASYATDGQTFFW